MGSSQSILTPEVAVAGAVVAGTVSAAAYGLYAKNAASGAGSTSSSGEPNSGSSASSKKKKKSAADKEKARVDAEFEKALAVANKENATKAKAPAHVVAFPSVVPGTFDSDAAAAMLAPSPQKPSAKKAKKKKAKKASAVGDESQDEESQAEAVASTVPVVETTPTPEPPAAALKKKRKGARGGAAADGRKDTSSKGTLGTGVSTGGPSRAQGLAESYVLSEAPEDASWTRVTSRRRGAGTVDTDFLTSDTNVTQTTTTESTEDDGEEEEEGRKQSADTPRRPLAERMLPKPRKTGVEEWVPAQSCYRQLV